jgi:hypothetical protein
MTSERGGDRPPAPLTVRSHHARRRVRRYWSAVVVFSFGDVHGSASRGAPITISLVLGSHRQTHRRCYAMGRDVPLAYDNTFRITRLLSTRELPCNR